MKLNTTVKLLQYLGAFPVIIEESAISNEKQISIKLSKKYLCCSAIQAVLTCCRIKKYLDLFKPSNSLEFLLMVYNGVEQIWVTAVLLLYLKNLKEIHKCFQGCNQALFSNDNHKSKINFGSIAFYNFCLQTWNITYLTIMMIRRSSSHKAILWFSKYISDLVAVLSYYCVLTILKILLVSYTQVNQRLWELSYVKSRKDFSTRSGLLLSDELEELVQKHWKTGDLLVKLNRAFGPLVFLFTSFIFTKFTLIVYYLSFKGAIYKYHDNPAFYVNVHAMFYAVSTMSLDFLLLCGSSHQVHSEKQKTLVILFRVLRRKSDLIKNGLNSKIRLFVYQTRSRQLKLTGCGFFYIDRPLFYGMVTMVISYFILLVQFNIVQ